MRLPRGSNSLSGHVGSIIIVGLGKDTTLRRQSSAALVDRLFMNYGKWIVADQRAE